MLSSYVRHRHWHLRDLVGVQTLLPGLVISGIQIGITNCTWDADDTIITMLVFGGIEFDSDLALVTVDTPMLGWLLCWRDSI